MKNKAMAALAALVLLFGGFTGGFFLGRNTRVEIPAAGDDPSHRTGHGAARPLRTGQTDGDEEVLRQHRKEGHLPREHQHGIEKGTGRPARHR